MVQDEIRFIYYKNGFNVIGIDKEATEAIIREKLTNEQNSRFKFIQNNFEKLPQLPKTDLILSSFSLPFCNPLRFKDFWKNISQSISNEKYFLGNFFGVNDEWNGKKILSFFSLEQVKELFKDFNIINISETEYDKRTAMNVMKHWDVIEVLAIHKNMEE